MAKQTLKNDKFKKARGGHSRLLDISCEKCGTHICYYQKDGPGILKRMYIDRIDGLNLAGYSLKDLPQLICANCKQHLGVPMNYKKEDRLAYRLFVGAVSKKITSLAKIG
jgi:hypothetical protein